MIHVYYMGLEPYRERYTELLTGWTTSRLKAAGIPHTVVQGEKLQGGIKDGRVLDAFGRSHWALTQMASLVRLLQHDQVEYPVIYFDDLFTPGYEALPYILDQVRSYRLADLRIYARNHAQSVDPDDFTFPMRRWMRSFESLAYETLSGVICASEVHREMMEIAMLPKTDNVHVLGLPYDEDDVQSRGPAVIPPLAERQREVLYSSRFDSEKQPHFFMDVVERCAMQKKAVNFVICTGANDVRSNDLSALKRLSVLESKGLVRIHRGCSKRDYYTVLANARVQLNTARQDFISYTAIEASSFGTPTLAPAFRSFPEFLNAKQMYIPWALGDTVDKIMELMDDPPSAGVISALSRDQHRTLDKIIRLMEQG